MPVPTAFSIQVGAYRETRYLEAAMEDLRSRGYVPYVVPVTGSGGQVFRTIRIGQYPTREEAVRAAAEFQHKESMAALVRKVTPETRLTQRPTKPRDELPAAEPPPAVGL
jgi:cell division septation protein DedD